MWFATVKSTPADGGARAIEVLVRQMGRLLRHPGYRRGNVVSSLLLRHLPADAGYAWQGEDVLRERLVRAQLDPATLEYLKAGVDFEIETLRKPAVR